ncbi:MAG: hypothetical protein AAF639_33550 [Chloroflexota bacterium]
MVYSDFTLRKAKKDFNLTEVMVPLFTPMPPIEQSAWLSQGLSLGRKNARSSYSEKARSEFLVAPILLELQSKDILPFAIHSGRNLDVDKEKGLNGECDFILSRGKITYEINAPIFAMIEAKKGDIEPHLGQCTAQMVGARFFNQNEGVEVDTIYGCITTGELWLFLKLEGDTVYIDENRYYLNELPKLLSVFKTILNFYNIPE